MQKWLFLLLVQGVTASSDHRASLESELANLQVQKESLTVDLNKLLDRAKQLQTQEYTGRRLTDCEQKLSDHFCSDFKSPLERAKTQILECQLNLSLVEGKIQDIKNKIIK